MRMDKTRCRNGDFSAWWCVEVGVESGCFIVVFGCPTRLGGNCLPRVCGNWDRDLAALTPRCAAGPYRWSMGNPAHTATQGVNLRIQGPKHPPIGPNTPPIPRAMPPSTHARARPTPATNARHALAAHTRTQSGPGLVTLSPARPTLGTGGRRNHPRRPGSINPSMRSWALQVEHGQPRPHRHPRG